jgi:hypothetical protein
MMRLLMQVGNPSWAEYVDRKWIDKSGRNIPNGYSCINETGLRLPANLSGIRQLVFPIGSPMPYSASPGEKASSSRLAPTHAFPLAFPRPCSWFSCMSASFLRFVPDHQDADAIGTSLEMCPTAWSIRACQAGAHGCLCKPWPNDLTRKKMANRKEYFRIKERVDDP